MQTDLPKDFLLSASTASYQIEGAWNQDGKGESIWDRFAHTEGTIHRGDTGDDACQHYRRFREDVALMREIGLNAYRFSIAWTRILPHGTGSINPKGLQFYSDLIDELRANGIEPMITLYHWDLPQALQDRGGWENRECIEWFAEYSRVVFEALGDKVRYWITINEPNVHAKLGYMTGTHAPGIACAETHLQVLHHLLVAHGRAVQVFREICPGGKIGFAPNLGAELHQEGNPESQAKAERNWLLHHCWYADPALVGAYPESTMDAHRAKGIAPKILPGDLETACQPIDFLGLNHYFTSFNGPVPAEAKPTAWGDPEKADWGGFVYPDGLRWVLRKIKERYGDLPIMITENGLPIIDETLSADGLCHDSDRTEYFEQYLAAVADAINEGIDVIGYSAWSLMDNFEWAEGYSYRFGLIHVNYADQTRRIKDSGHAYDKSAEICKQAYAAKGADRVTRSFHLSR